MTPIINFTFTEMNYKSDSEIAGTSQNTVERGERGLLKDFIPVPVFNKRTLERMKKMERRGSKGGRQETEEDGKTNRREICSRCV